MSYPASEVRGRSWKDPMPKGGSQEELPHVRSQGKRPRVPGCNGAGMAKRSYPSPRSGAAARRSYPTSEVRGGGREELPHVRSQGQRPRGATPHPRPGAVAGRTSPMSKERWLCGHRRAYRSYPTLKVRRGGSEEIPLVHGKEQWLCFAGAAVKRYPTPKVRETQVRR